MALTGPQHQQLQSALLAAFDEAGLRMLARQELDVELDAAAGGRNRKEVILNLIAWAEREHRTADQGSADFYAQCAQFENLRLALQDSQRYIGPMSADELTAVIERPAAAKSVHEVAQMHITGVISPCEWYRGRLANA